MRSRWVTVVVVLCTGLAGCDTSSQNPDPPGASNTTLAGDEDEESGMESPIESGSEAEMETPIEYAPEDYMFALFQHEIIEAEVAPLVSVIEEIATEVHLEFMPGRLDIQVNPGGEAIPAECFSWALPSLWVEYDQDVHDALAMVAAFEDFDAVVALTAPGLETALPAAPDGEEAFIACESRWLSVYLDPDFASETESMRSVAMASAGVFATAVESEISSNFVPDLSAYPEMESCYEAPWLELQIVFDEVDSPGVEGVISQLEDLPGVIGIRGMHLETVEGDPVDRLLNQEFDVRCEVIEGYVELDPEITDEEAAVVVARARSLPGVADVYLQLVDPDSIEPCPEEDPTSDVHYDCFVPSSYLTVYRGDPALATPEAISEALLGLPGVLWVDAYDLEDLGFGGEEGPDLEVDASGAAPTGGTQLPDIDGAVAGDDGQGPVPLGEITTVPESVQLDFLFELCRGDRCFRDAHFLDPDDPALGSGPFPSDTPFHVRHGFVSNGEDPLGEGFDVVIYVTAMESGEPTSESADIGQTYRYTSDYVIQGTSETCGPNYRSQTGPEPCQWFVHEFDEGLPQGRHALWAFWEAPCSAWIEYGFTEGCEAPDEVISLFSSGFDSPFGTEPPEYTESAGSGDDY
jgi:hypothetical protein